MFERFTEHIWTTTQPQRFWGLETGTRMTLVRLSGGGLVVHAPVAPTPEIQEEGEALGEVRAIVAPSLFHHLYVGAWAAAYPDAEVCACPRLERKRPDVAWSVVLGDDPHPLWAEDLDQAYFSARFEHEILLFDRRSNTLLCCDSLLNLSTHPNRTTRFVAALMGNNAPGKGYLERIAVRRWGQARREVARILEWPIERIVLAHGALVERDGHRVFREAYAWLKP